MKNKFVIGGLVALGFLALIAWGFYNNPERQLEPVMELMSATTQELRSFLIENKTCFEDSSIQNGESTKCVSELQKIRNYFNTVDKENISKLQIFFEENGSRLEDENRLIIENSLKLNTSPAYKDLGLAYDQYFGAYIEWHKFFRDVVGLKGVDNMSDEELMRTKTLAQDVVTAEENLQLKVNALSDYLRENFDKEFIEAVGGQTGNQL